MNALWWWIDRWRKSTAYTDMRLEEQGAYRNLLDEATLRGGAIPNDERILARACGDALRWKKVRAAVMARWTLTPEGWRNATLDAVNRESERRRLNQAAYRARQHGPGNRPDNGPGNGPDNGPDNGTDNGPDNGPDNNPDSPISDLCLVPTPTPPKGRGGRRVLKRIGLSADAESLERQAEAVQQQIAAAKARVAG